MNKLHDAVHEIKTVDQLAREDRWVNRIHPLIKLLITFFYIGLLVSIPKYQLQKMVLMAIYPFAMFALGDINVLQGIKRLRIILPLVCIVGIFNPFYDRSVIMNIGSIRISGGVVSMVVLMLKGVFAVLAGYLLVVTTTVEKICMAFRQLHVPKMLVTQFMLSMRYVTVLLEEAGRMMQAYSLRAPGQKGVHFKVWGPMIGQLLLRSMDRAQVLYESMCLRGYDGEFEMGGTRGIRAQDGIYAIICLSFFLMIRFIV